MSTSTSHRPKSPRTAKSENDFPLCAVKEHNGSPAVFINGKPTAFFIYSQVPEPDAKHIQQFAKIGVHLYELITKDWKNFGWQGEGKFDFTPFDSTVQRLLEADPEGYFFPRIYVEAPPWWRQAYPEELAAYADGTKDKEFAALAFTFFSRDQHVLELVVEHLLPLLGGRSHPRIWDAGCAMGPEPYSVAIIIRENMGPMIFRNVKIHATDIDESNLFGDVIRKGVYPEEQVKRIPKEIKEILEKYFERNCRQGHFEIVDEIKRCVEYYQHDLLSLKPIRDNLSLIVCKNVLLHFKEQERVNVIKMFHDSLAKGGFFVTEQTQKLPRKVERLFERVVSNAQVFRKVNGTA